MPGELQTIAKSIKSAKCPEDVFGGSDTKTITTVYRQLVLVIHPDHFQDSPKELTLAKETFNLLTDLRLAAERKVKAGTYGDKKIAAPPPKAPFSAHLVEANGKKYILTQELASGDICDLYLATLPNEHERKVVFKIVKNGSNNDLVENEYKTLLKIRFGVPTDKPDEKFYHFIPRIESSFILRGPGSQRRVNILPWYNEHRSLVEVMHVYPDGIDFRDMAWMFKRILHGIGFAHEKHQLIHGAIIPPHVLIHPVDHGAKILDWSYALSREAPKPTTKKSSFYDHLNDDDFLDVPHINAISADYKDYYPKEILTKQTPTAATDIYMAAKCAVALVGGDVKTNQMPDSVPKQVQAFFSSCLHEDPTKRPQNAWDAHEHLDEVLRNIVGKRKYRPFPMPMLSV